MKVSYLPGAIAVGLGFLYSITGYAAWENFYGPQYGMPSFFGTVLSKQGETITFYWQTIFSILSLCAVPLIIAYQYVRDERREKHAPSYPSEAQRAEERYIEEEKERRKAA